MKIRSITIFDGSPHARTPDAIARSGKAAAAVRRRLAHAGFEIQTTRLALAPAYLWMAGLSTANAVDAARAIETLATDAGIDYVSLGPVADDRAHLPEIERLPDLIAGTRSIFASVPIASASVVNAWALHATARAIKGIAASTENGFGNLRVAALAQCECGIPFFPAAYAAEGEFSCALAMECADLALDAVTRMASLPEAMVELTERIEHQAGLIENALEGVQDATGAAFSGCDWSLAPHPDQKCSIGAAIEKLSGAPFGEWGTLSAVAALTHAIQSADVAHVGFSGVFLPLLEDAVLARRMSGVTDLQSLLLYCAVCGSGLDTIPLPGDVSAESIAALLGDVATLATVLCKPLTARLMPVPGLNAGDATRFEFPYIVNGRVLDLKGGGTDMWRDDFMGSLIF